MGSKRCSRASPICRRYARSVSSSGPLHAGRRLRPGDCFLETVEDLFRRLEQLNEIGAALSQEKDIDHLLEKILLAAKTITRAAGGTLYVLEPSDEGPRLRFAIVRNESLGIAMGGTTGNPKPTCYPVHLYGKDGKPNNQMVAAYAALTGKTVNIADAYAEEGFDFSGTRNFDKKTGYRSKAFLTVPMKDHQSEIIGVLQLINSMDPATNEIGPFSYSDQRLAESLASQAAIALTNRQLIIQLEELFKSFIELINKAIDEKSAYTGGHCKRVPELTMMLADAVNETSEGPLRDFNMSDKDRYELEIAGLLHDCGKVTTPVHVVDKATKLETIFDRINLVDTRFELGRLVHDVHGSGHLPAVVQQTRYLELVAVLVAHVEIPERPLGGLVDGLGKHHGELRDAFAVPSRVGGFLIDRFIDELDKRLEQFLQLNDELPVGKRNGGLRRKRFRQALVRVRERPDFVRRGIHAVDQLEYPDDFALVVLHRYREERLGAVPGLLVEIARSGEIETLLRIRVGEIHRLAGQGGVGSDHLVVGLSVLSIQMHRIESRFRIAGGAAHRDPQRLVSHDREPEPGSLVGGFQHVQGATGGACDRLGREKDFLEQMVDVLFLGQRRAYLVELLEAAKQAFDGLQETIPRSQAAAGVERAAT